MNPSIGNFNFNYFCFIKIFFLENRVCLFVSFKIGKNSKLTETNEETRRLNPGSFASWDFLNPGRFVSWTFGNWMS